MKHINDRSDSINNLKYLKGSFLKFMSSYSFEREIIYTF